MSLVSTVIINDTIDMRFTDNGSTVEAILIFYLFVFFSVTSAFTCCFQTTKKSQAIIVLKGLHHYLQCYWRTSTLFYSLSLTISSRISLVSKTPMLFVRTYTLISITSTLFSRTSGPPPWSQWPPPCSQGPPIYSPGLADWSLWLPEEFDRPINDYRFYSKDSNGAQESVDGSLSWRSKVNLLSNHNRRGPI